MVVVALQSEPLQVGLFGTAGVGVDLDRSHFVQGTVTVTVLGPLPQPDWHTLVVTSQP